MVLLQASGPITAYELLDRLRAERSATAAGVYRSLDFLVAQGLAYATQTTALLFGNVLAVDMGTVWTLLGLGVFSLGTLAFISRPLLFASLQPELAEAKGVSLRLYSVLFAALVALAVAECV